MGLFQLAVDAAIQERESRREGQHEHQADTEEALQVTEVALVDVVGVDRHLELAVALFLLRPRGETQVAHRQDVGEDRVDAVQGSHDLRTHQLAGFSQDLARRQERQLLEEPGRVDHQALVQVEAVHQGQQAFGVPGNARDLLGGEDAPRSDRPGRSVLLQEEVQPELRDPGRHAHAADLGTALLQAVDVLLVTQVDGQGAQG